MASAAYGTIARPTRSGGSTLASVIPRDKVLKGSVHARVYHISATEDDEATLFAPKFPKLLSRMYELFKAEIEDGNTYPQEELDDGQFRAYFFAYDAFVALRTTKGEDLQEHDKGISLEDDKADWDEQVLGFFYVKPNFPGRCSHICNGGFFTDPKARNLGVGRFMAENFLEVAPALGYKASMFNLVFANNPASIKLWRSLNFVEIGRIPKAGRLRSSEALVDAIIFYYDFAGAKGAL